ncbi:glycosyltransferase family 4 protein [Massilia sp. S19_KUP03_FR1]|uniref:glycosyltransferase family 4 protein n=1 Tax=Massilia sp. S19_KUP03_FR1 TaxID=3025503 RepID=UPI002FCD82E1
MTIWLDVTTVRGWHRPALGIVRVEAETARQFLARRDGAIRFCRFDLAYKAYFEVGPEELQFALERIDAGGVHPASLAAAAAGLPAPEQMAPQPGWRGNVLRAVARLPRELQQPLLQFARVRMDGARALRASLRAVGSAAMLFVRGRPPLPASAPAAAPAPALVKPDLLFGRGDVVVSLGLDWDQKDLPYLYTLRQALDLHILLMCYDIIPIRLPHLCVADVARKFPGYFLDVARCADEVVCISAYSRQDLRAYLEECQVALPELSLVRLGCEIGPVAPAQAPVAPAVAELLGQQYILFVSTIERRKNHETVYRAYTRLVDAGVQDLPVLVFVGMAGWGQAELMADLARDPRIRSCLRILNHVSDGDLALLYRHAYFTVYPSLYEGWGLPVAESLAYGKFCLVSNAASLPEVGGDLVEYIDPWDVPRWAERLQWYIANPDAVAQRSAAIRDQYRAPSWHATGATLVAAAEALQQRAQAGPGR